MAFSFVFPKYYCSNQSKERIAAIGNPKTKQPVCKNKSIFLSKLGVLNKPH
jgi:hypothetical protein